MVRQLGRVLMLLPYAVAPAVAAVLWIFLFNPGRGLITLGEAERLDHAQNSGQAMFRGLPRCGSGQATTSCFFFAALQSIPRSLVEGPPLSAPGRFVASLSWRCR